MLEPLALCLAPIVHDGDSFRCDGQRYRLQALSGPIDAPEWESSPPCRDARRETRICDDARARQARDYLAGLLRPGGTMTCAGADRYGRALCRVTVNGRDVGDAMVVAGMARIVEGWR